MRRVIHRDPGRRRAARMACCLAGACLFSVQPVRAAPSAQPVHETTPPAASFASSDPRWALDLGFAADGVPGAPVAPARAEPLPTAPEGFVDAPLAGSLQPDYHDFLQHYDADELIGEWRSVLDAGASSRAARYLLALSYANPALVNVLDMMDRQLGLRFSAMRQVLQQDALNRASDDPAARAWSAYAAACYDRERAHRAAPGLALRRCYQSGEALGRGDAEDASSETFLRSLRGVAWRDDELALLATVPDLRIVHGRLQTRAAELTIEQIHERLRRRTARALEAIEGGKALEIAVCRGRNWHASTPASTCLPEGAFLLAKSIPVASLGLRDASARTMLREALASQVATAALRTDLDHLHQKLAHAPAAGYGSPPSSVAGTRLRHLADAIEEVEKEVSRMAAIQAERTQLVRLQVLALERRRRELDIKADRLEASRSGSFDGVLDRGPPGRTR